MRASRRRLKRPWAGVGVVSSWMAGALSAAELELELLLAGVLMIEAGRRNH
jgi:hypothetical protein